MAVIVKLKYANTGWHVRWTTPCAQEFQETTDAFKDLLPVRERRWDENAFDGQGGWWITYSALQEIGHLFANYQLERATVEALSRRGNRRRKSRSGGRFAREQRLKQQQQATPRQPPNQQGVPAQPHQDRPALYEQPLVEYPDQPY